MTDATNTDNGQAFDRWFDSFLDDYLKRRPVSATFIGAHQYDHALPDFSTEADADLVASARDLIATLDAIPNDGLTEAQIHDRALVRGFLEIQLWEVDSPYFQAGNPSHHTGEAAFSVISLFQRDAEPQADRVEAAIQRMAGCRAFLQTARERVAAAPLVWTERAIREADAGAEYFGNGLRILADERGIERPAFLRQAKVAAQAFRRSCRLAAQRSFGALRPPSSQRARKHSTAICRRGIFSRPSRTASGGSITPAPS